MPEGKNLEWQNPISHKGPPPGILSLLTLYKKLMEFSNFSRHQIHPEGLSGPTPEDPNSMGLGWSPRIHISNKFPCTTDPAGSRSTL